MSQENRPEVMKLNQIELSRIESLLEQGKINIDEATLLIDAIVETVDAPDNPMNSEAINSEAITPPPPAPFSPVDFTKTSVTQTESEPTHWLTATVSAGSITIKGDATLSKPVIEEVHGINIDGSKELKEENGNYRIDSSFDAMILRLPPNMGLHLSVSAGEAKVTDVAFLKGNNSVGSVQAKRVGGLDFKVEAGDFVGSALLTKGEHRLSVKAGSAKLELLAGSSLDLSGTCNLGSFTVPENFSTKDNPIKGSFQGVIGTSLIGTGTATLKVKVQAGDVRITEQGN